MKQYVVFILVVGVLNAFAEIPNWETQRQSVIELTSLLRVQGAYAFVCNQSTPKSAPRIHSRYWVDLIPKEEVLRKAYEEEARRFGLEFCRQLERLSFPELELQDADGREKYAEQMLKIASWLKTEHGYENYILKTWAENLALSVLGAMVLNVECDTNRVVRLMSRVDDLSRDLDFRMDILNEEAPHAFSRPKGREPHEIAHNLERQWSKHLRFALQTLVAIGHLKYPEGYWDDVKDASPEYSFYFDSRRRGWGMPCEEWWEKKQHRMVCVAGCSDRLEYELTKLLHYREVVGFIPSCLNADMTVKDEYEYKLEIDRNWWKFDPEKGMPPSIHNSVYQIVNGCFYDLHSQMLDRLRGNKRAQRMIYGGRL